MYLVMNLLERDTMHRIMKYHIQPRTTAKSTLNCGSSGRMQKVTPKGNRKRRHNPARADRRTNRDEKVELEIAQLMKNEKKTPCKSSQSFFGFSEGISWLN